MNEFLNANGGLLGLAAILIGLGQFFAQYLLSENKSYTKSQLASEKGRNRIKDRIRGAAADDYFRYVAKTEEWAVRIYGARIVSFNAFDRCISIAVIYALFATLLAWVIFDQHSPGGYSIFIPAIPDRFRILNGALVASAVVLTFKIFSNFEEISSFIRDKIISLSQRVGFCLEASRWLKPFSSFIVGTIAFAVAFVGAFIFAFTGADAGAFAVAVAFVFAFSGAFAFVVAFSGAFASVVAGAEPNLSVAIFLMFFFFVLPIVNAIADFISIGCTRFFLRHISGDTRPSLFSIIWRVLLDLGIGLACLGGLLLLLTQALDLWSWASPDTAPLDWRAYWATALDDPRQGFALWFMIFTTLIPTIIHLFAGLGGIITHWSRLKSRVLREITRMEDAGEPFDETECDHLAVQLRRANMIGFFIASVIVFAFIWVLMLIFS